MAAGKTSPEMTRQYRTSSAAETIEAGIKIANLLAAPSVVVLTGDLGAGKTTLVKGIAEGFQAAEEEDVTSPTFTLVHEYRGPSVNLFHIDLYRIDSDRELLTLGLDDLIDLRSILLIEWGEKFERFRRERDVEITIRRVGEHEREINVILTAGAREHN
jgi:tRNA threonylcarbamoyladenosine biosynthesis protein TsaE